MRKHAVIYTLACIWIVIGCIAAIAFLAHLQMSGRLRAFETSTVMLAGWILLSVVFKLAHERLIRSKAEQCRKILKEQYYPLLHFVRRKYRNFLFTPGTYWHCGSPPLIFNAYTKVARTNLPCAHQVLGDLLNENFFMCPECGRIAVDEECGRDGVSLEEILDGGDYEDEDSDDYDEDDFEDEDEEGDVRARR